MQRLRILIAAPMGAVVLVAVAFDAVKEASGAWSVGDRSRVSP